MVGRERRSGGGEGCSGGGRDVVVGGGMCGGRRDVVVGGGM